MIYVDTKIFWIKDKEVEAAKAYFLELPTMQEYQNWQLCFGCVNEN